MSQWTDFCNAVCCLVGLEKASCALVEVCLANPQYFYVTEVLGPACVAIAEAEANVLALTREYYLYIKSILGHKLVVVCEPPVSGVVSKLLQLPVMHGRAERRLSWQNLSPGLHAPLSFHASLQTHVNCLAIDCCIMPIIQSKPAEVVVF